MSSQHTSRPIFHYIPQPVPSPPTQHPGAVGSQVNTQSIPRQQSSATPQPVPSPSTAERTGSVGLQVNSPPIDRQRSSATPQPGPPPPATLPLLIPRSTAHTKAILGDPRIAKNPSRRLSQPSDRQRRVEMSEHTHTIASGGRGTKTKGLLGDYPCSSSGKKTSFSVLTPSHASTAQSWLHDSSGLNMRDNSSSSNQKTKTRFDNQLLKQLREITAKYTSLPPSDLATRGGNQTCSRGEVIPSVTLGNDAEPVWMTKKDVEPVSNWPPVSSTLAPISGRADGYSATARSTYYIPDDAASCQQKDEQRSVTSRHSSMSPPSISRAMAASNKISLSEYRNKSSKTQPTVPETRPGSMPLAPDQRADNSAKGIPKAVRAAVSGSVLNLPISPREIANAQVALQEKMRAEMYQRRTYDVEDIDPLLRHQYCASDRILPRPRAETSRDCDSELPPPRRKRPLESYAASQPLTKRTWPTPQSEKAPITEDLLVYVEMKGCDLCKVIYNHPVHAKAHLLGKNHHKKLKTLGLPIPDYCVDKSKPENALRLQAKSSDGDKETCAEEDKEVPWPDWMQDQMEDDFCHICNTPLSSVSTADAHYYGKKHLKKCNAVYSLGEGAGTANVTPFCCEVCHIYCSSAQIMEQHIAGSKHQQALHWKRAINDGPLVSDVRVREVAVQEAGETNDEFLAKAAEMNSFP